MWLNTSANVVSRQPVRLLRATLLNYDLLLVLCPSFLVCIEVDCWIDLDRRKEAFEMHLEIKFAPTVTQRCHTPAML